MKEHIDDIKEKILSNKYKNEEHVKLSLVCRILSSLGWNIWDPEEVYAEYVPISYEDNKRVDFALFLFPRKPIVFIEVKTIGKVSEDLQKVESQLRDYNRDNTALFSIITDGQTWRFYYSQTGGRFPEKCFKVIDFFDDDSDEIENIFKKFLSKDEILNERAKEEAEKYLRLTEKQKIMEELLPQAKKSILEPPYPNLIEALKELGTESGIGINEEEAADFCRNVGTEISRPIQTSKHTIAENRDISTRDAVENFDPEDTPDLRFAKLEYAKFGGNSVNNWNELVRLGIETCLNSGISIDELKRIDIPVIEGTKVDEGYRPLRNFDVSFQYVSANHAWRIALAMAKKLKAEIEVSFRWRYKDKAAYPGKRGLLHWNP